MTIEQAKKVHARYSTLYKVMLTGMAIAGALMLLLALALLWPYDRVSFSDQPADVVSDEWTEGGIPVVRAGDSLQLQFSFCNHAQDTKSIRWFDRYTGTVPGFDDERDDETEPVQSLAAPDVLYYSNGVDRCQDDAITETTIPSYIPTGYVYRYRVNVIYKPNFARTVQENFDSTPFLYLGANDPIPEA